MEKKLFITVLISNFLVANYDPKLAKDKENVIEIVAVGSGPAGLTVGVYGARGGYLTGVFQGPKPGGQLMDASVVENWPGVLSCSGAAHIKILEKQAKEFGAHIIPETIEDLDVNSWPFKIKTNKNTYHALAIVLTMGANAKKLGVPGEDKYFGHVVFTCTVCDAPLTKNQDVIVVGGGDAAVERAVQLAKYAKKVTMLIRKNKMRAARRNQNRLKRYKNIKVLYNKDVKEILGNGERVTGVLAYDNKENKNITIKAHWVVLSVGFHPNTEIIQDKIKLTTCGYIWHKAGSRETSTRGIYCAGNVCDWKYRQAGSAAGDASKATLDAIAFLNDLGFDNVSRKYVKSNLYKPVTIKHKVKEIMEENKLLDLIKDQKPSLVEFYSEFCPHCIQMAPIIEELYAKLNKQINFAKVEVNKAPELAQKYNIHAMPTFVVFKNSNEIKRQVGSMSQTDLETFILN